MKHVGGSGFWGFCTNENCPTEEMMTEKTGTEATIASPSGNMSYVSKSIFLKLLTLLDLKPFLLLCQKLKCQKVFSFSNEKRF